MKYLQKFEEMNKDYLTYSFTQEYEDLTDDLWEGIQEEGFVDDLIDFYGETYEQEDFEYIILNISDEDKNGLISGDNNTLDKFNDFDLELKKEQEPDYPTMVDFIDYDNGLVYVIRLV